MMNKIIYDEECGVYDFNTTDFNLLANDSLFCHKDRIVELLKDVEEVTCCYSDGSLLHKTTNVDFACVLITGYKGSYITW